MGLDEHAFRRELTMAHEGRPWPNDGRVRILWEWCLAFVTLGEWARHEGLCQLNPYLRNFRGRP